MLRASVPVCRADLDGPRTIRKVWRFTGDDEVESLRECAITIVDKAYGYVPIEMCIFLNNEKAGFYEDRRRPIHDCPEIHLSTQELLRRASSD